MTRLSAPGPLTLGETIAGLATLVFIAAFAVACAIQVAPTPETRFCFAMIAYLAGFVTVLLVAVPWHRHRIAETAGELR
jgi:hypothetical protein